MDPVDISSTVDITDAFRVAGEATADMSVTLFRFLSLVLGEGPLRKWTTEIFELSVLILGCIITK